MSKASEGLAAILVISLLTASLLGICTEFSKAQAAPPYGDWNLTVNGLAEHPLNLTLTEIASMPSISEYAILYCVDFPNTPVTAGVWVGVKLSYLLELVGANQTAKVGFFASDGYSTDLSMQQATQDDVILAYQLNGAPLNETLRLVVPGHWGYKWIAEVTSIQLLGYNYLGVWETRGYSDEASTSSPSGISTKPPPPYIDYPELSSSPGVSPLPSATTPEAAPTQNPTPTPSPSSSPTSFPTAASPYASNSPLPSSVSTTPPKPDSSHEATSEMSVPVYVLFLGVLGAVITTVFLRRRRKVSKT